MLPNDDPPKGYPGDDTNNNAHPPAAVSSWSVQGVRLGFGSLLDKLTSGFDTWLILDRCGSFVDHMEELIFKSFKLAVKILLVAATAVLAYLSIRDALQIVYLITTGGVNGLH